MSAIDILPDDEDTQIVDSVIDVIDAEFPLDRLQVRGGATLTSAQWRMASEMGWLNLSLMEAQGGLSLGVTTEALLHREFGRKLISPSLLATSAVVHFAAENGEETIRYLSGERIGAFALTHANGFYFIDAQRADSVVAPSGNGYDLIDLSDLQMGVTLDAMDPTLPLVEGRGAGARRRMSETNALRIGLLLSATLSGIADAAAHMATEYAKIREQFGKPIGSFQAIGHACADAAMRSEAAQVQVLFSAIALRDGHPDARFQVASAARTAANAAFANATMNIHTHGGMGYSAECRAHLYLKRAVLLQRLISPLTSDTKILLGEGAILE